MSVQSGDSIFLHSNLGFSGICKEINPAATILDSILTKIGPRGKLFLPAFSYAFPEGRTFNPTVLNFLSAMGAVSIYSYSVGFQLSRDPIFGVLGKGEGVDELFRAQTNRSFGPGSLFSTLLDSNVKMLSINTGAGGTILHEMEYRLSVPYRFDKKFQGKVLDSETKVIKDISWTSYVRDLENPTTEAKFDYLTELLYKENIWQKFKLGKGYISCANSLDVYYYISKAIRLDPNILLK